MFLGKFTLVGYHTSGNQTTVQVANTIDEVYGVWLESDYSRIGRNYYTGGSTAGKVITVGTLLPQEETPVKIHYKAIHSDAVEYFYHIYVYDESIDEWSTGSSASGFCEYTSNVIIPETVDWVFFRYSKIVA